MLLVVVDKVQDPNSLELEHAQVRRRKLKYSRTVLLPDVKSEEVVEGKGAGDEAEKGKKKKEIIMRKQTN